MRQRIAPIVNTLNPLQSLIARRWRPQWVCQSCRPRHQRLWPRSLSSSTTTRSTTDKTPSKPYYVTTPIFYVNAAPHVGHMYTMILADVLKRWQVMKGHRSILLTGTDEHGMKIQRAAALAGVDPKEFCDQGADVFRNLAASVDLSNDIFIRTTDLQHRDGVEYAWQMLNERGYIYESKHEGWYSVSDETFYPKSQVHMVVDPPTGRKMMASVETGKEVEWTSERNYHFRLSAFRDKLLAFYEANPDFIVPATRMQDVINQVSVGLEDLSISRPSERLQWGIPVPTDPSQTIYVWLDALLNYATAIGYPFTPGRESSTGWPADVQVVGKDIVRFHCIYWPAILMALDLPPPRQILTHAHWTLGRQKMAKSTGNVVSPFFALERFGVDAMRWYLVHEGGIEDDADYDNKFIIEKYKKALQGGLGNLSARVMRGKGWNVRRAVKRFAHPEHVHSTKSSLEGEDNVPPTTPAEEGARFPAFLASTDRLHRGIYGSIRLTPSRADAEMRALHPNRALAAIMHTVYKTNAFLQATAPWELAQKILNDKAMPAERKEEMQREIDKVIYLAAESLRVCGILLTPFMPGKAGMLLDLLGVEQDRREWEWAVVGKDKTYGGMEVQGGDGVVRKGRVEKQEGVLFPGLTSLF
ncbi:unnamed protein product [Zymoseptoria tritici ST99CH_3D7]|uniref:Probable methionine--tRNA ligase, mitochondrial n=1 Tax=Zymoseptoria tritici (strain ST99CH_3D7) TaxID=1276538 RepID=A0A1X7RYE1_ZYMT9|nr:unnamed protein product [Zymoseptoria tritici ST99CH_3D7]